MHAWMPVVRTDTRTGLTAQQLNDAEEAVNDELLVDLGGRVGADCT